MPTFIAPDGSELAFDVKGAADDDAAPLIVIPGGPMRDPVYLGDLGGLSAHRQLIILNLRGTGASAVPADRASYRCDRQVADIEALRVHLGLEQLDLLGHSAGANLAVLYAAKHPERINKLTLAAPSLRVLGLGPTDEGREQAWRLRRHEPWYAEAEAAVRRIDEDEDGASDEDWLLYSRFAHGRWDEEIEEFERSSESQGNDEAASTYISDGAFDPPTTKAALAKLSAPVLILAAEYDWNPRPLVAAQAAGCFPNARLAVQAGAGHFPWLDNREAFVRLVTES